MPFVYDEANFLTNQKCFIITGQNIMALIGPIINDSAAPTYINLIFALSLMGDMPTNKARTSDYAQQQSASNAVSIFYSVF